MSGEHLADEIMVADRGAADGDEDVGAVGDRLRQLVVDGRFAVGRDAAIQRQAAGLAHQCGDAEGVGGDDLRRADGFAWQDAVRRRSPGSPRGDGADRQIAGWPPLAASAMAPGVSTRAGGQKRRPAAKSTPAGRMCWPTTTGAVGVTVSPSGARHSPG